MKFFCVALCLAVAGIVVDGQGIPTKKCPPGEHSVLYCPRKAEPDCNNSNIHEYTDGTPRACGIPDCFCDQPNVRDLTTGKCVELGKCPKCPKLQ